MLTVLDKSRVFSVVKGMKGKRKNFHSHSLTETKFIPDINQKKNVMRLKIENKDVDIDDILTFESSKLLERTKTEIHVFTKTINNNNGLADNQHKE